MKRKSVTFSRSLLSPVLGIGLTFGSGLAAAADLTVTAYGGSWEQAYRTCFVQPFEKATGKKVDVILGSPTQWINQIAANPQKPPIDVMVGAVDSGKLARERGLVEAISAKEVPNYAQLLPRLVEFGGGYGFPVTYGNFGLMYNTSEVKDPPKSWQEFVDGVVAGKWRAGIPGIAYSGTTQGLIGLFATVFGGSLDNAQVAIDQVKRMRDSGNVVFYSEPNSPLVSLRNGDIDMAMYFDGRAWAEHDAGTSIIGYINPTPGSVAWPNMAQKVKNGSPLGWDSLNTLASAEGQTCFANAMQYAASNTQVSYSDKVKPRVATEGGSLWISFDDVAKNSASWIELWNKQIGR